MCRRLRGFYRFLEARKAAEIEAAFGVRLCCPVDEFNAARHVGEEAGAAVAPPTPERVTEFFGFCKHRITQRGSTLRPRGTMRCFERCITRGCGPRKW